MKIRKGRFQSITTFSFSCLMSISASMHVHGYTAQNENGETLISNKTMAEKTVSDELGYILDGNGSYVLTRKNKITGRQRFSSQKIHLRRGGKFDPLEDPNVSLTSRFSMQGVNQTPSLFQSITHEKYSTHIVQFHSQMLPGDKSQVAKLGGEIVSAFPPNAVLVVMDPKKALKLQSLSSVRAIAPYLPIYKIEEGLEDRIASQETESKTYSIMAVSKTHRQGLVRFIESIGAELVTDNVQFSNVQSSRLTAKLNAIQLLQVTTHPLTLFIDSRGEEGEDLNQVNDREGFNYIEQVAGYRGEGIGAEVYDRGYLTTHQEFSGNPLIVRSPAASTSAGGLNHGTEIAGILFAQGVDSSVVGLLKNAARPIVFSRYSGFPDNKQPTESELRNHLAELIEPSGPYRAVLQTSSTDYSTTTSYTTWSAEYDEVMFDLNLLKLQSQSNTGNRNSRPAAWAKNVVGVGGLDTGNTVSRGDDSWGGASIGPASDGRLQPDLSGQYGGIRTTDDTSNSAYRDFGGTSGSTPTVAGAFGILYQMWGDGVFDGGPGKGRDPFDVRPQTATARALMYNTAFRYPFTGSSHNLTRVHQGWGFPDLKNLYDTAQANGWGFPILIDETEPVALATSNSYSLNVDGNSPLNVTMVYRDLRGNPAAAYQRINDLSLRVTSPSGTIYWGNNGLNEGNWSTPGGQSNTVDTVENVFIQAPQDGNWTIEVLGDDIVLDAHSATPQLDATYALVASGGNSAPPANQPPTVVAGADTSVKMPNMASVSSTINDDNFPGTSLTINWSQTAGPGTASFTDASAENTTVSFNAVGNYTLRITADDSEYSSFDELNVVVSAAHTNQAPNVSAGSDQTITLPSSASLNGSCSDDGLPGSGLSCVWNGPAGVTFGNANNANTTATFSSSGNYTLTLTGNDGELSANDTVLITVNPAPVNQPPTANAGPDLNYNLSDTGTLAGVCSDDGLPSGNVSASWTGSAGVIFANANNENTNITFNSTGTFNVTLTCNDGEYTGTDSAQIIVADDPAGPVELISDDFESGLGNWQNISGDDNYDWTRDSGGTPSNSTGPATGAGGSNWYLYLETSSSNGAYNAGDSAIIESPVLSGSDRQLSFDYHMYGADIGTLSVEVSENGGVWQSVWSVSGQQHTDHSSNYSNQLIDLSEYSGSLVIRFKAVAAGNWKGDIAIDNLVVTSGSNEPINQAPISNAGTDISILLSETADLNGSCTDDGLPSGSLTSNWTGQSGVSFVDSSSATTSVNFSSVGSFELTLTCDDSLLSASDTVMVTVSDNGGSANVIFSDSFESGLGNWSNTTNGDTNDWSRDSGGTPSSSTGPATGANGSSWYVYLETSSGSGAYDSGNNAYLLSPTISATDVSLKFDYHMYGSNMGTLSVDVLADGSWQNDVWTISSQQHSASSDAYTSTTVNLSSYNVAQIRFRATAIGGYRGDMAIDNVEISGIGGGSSVTTISESDFESGLGDWLNPTTGDDYDWTEITGSTPSSNTGPNSGANGSSNYLFMETSDGGRGAFNAGETAFLESISFSGSNRTFSFDYHMYGSEMGTLSVDVFHGGAWISDVWSISGEQHTSTSEAFSSASVDLSGYSGSIKIRMRGTAAGGWHGDMAIDNLKLIGEM